MKKKENREFFILPQTAEPDFRLEPAAVLQLFQTEQAEPELTVPPALHFPVEPVAADQRF